MRKEIAAQIADKKAHYVLALKGNHATVHEQIKELFTDAVPNSTVFSPGTCACGRIMRTSRGISPSAPTSSTRRSCECD